MARRSRMLFSSSTTRTRASLMPGTLPRARVRPRGPRAPAGVGGQRQEKRGAQPGLAAHLHLAAVVLRDAVDRREAEPGAAGLRGEERLEDVREVGRRDPVAGVADPRLDA